MSDLIGNPAYLPSESEMVDWMSHVLQRVDGIEYQFLDTQKGSYVVAYQRSTGKVLASGINQSKVERNAEKAFKRLQNQNKRASKRSKRA